MADYYNDYNDNDDGDGCSDRDQYQDWDSASEEESQCTDSARCKDAYCMYRSWSCDPHNDWMGLKKRSRSYATAWNDMVTCRDHILSLQSYESAATVDVVGRAVLILNAIQERIHCYPEEIKQQSSIGWTMGRLFKFILPEIEESSIGTKKARRAMHKLARDTLAFVVCAIPSYAKLFPNPHDRPTCVGQHPSLTASPPASSEEVCKSRILLKNHDGTNVDVPTREAVCVSKDNEVEQVMEQIQAIQLCSEVIFEGPFGPHKVMLPQGWCCNYNED